eukprot:Pgem_evm1s6908
MKFCLISISLVSQFHSSLSADWGTASNLYKGKDLISDEVKECISSNDQFYLNYNPDTDQIDASVTLPFCHGNAGRNEETGYIYKEITKDSGHLKNTHNRESRPKRIDVWATGPN